MPVISLQNLYDKVAAQTSHQIDEEKYIRMQGHIRVICKCNKPPRYMPGISLQNFYDEVAAQIFHQIDEEKYIR